MLISGGEAAACASGWLGSHSRPRGARPLMERGEPAPPDAPRLDLDRAFFARLVLFPVPFFAAMVASRCGGPTAIFSPPDPPGHAATAACAPFRPHVSASRTPLPTS